MPPPSKVGVRRAASWSHCLKNSRKIAELICVLALANMGLGDKTAALALAEKAIAGNPPDNDVVNGPFSLEVLARVAAQTGEVRPRHRRFTEATLHTVLWRIHHYAAHSRTAPARSHVRSIARQSAFPKTL